MCGWPVQTDELVRSPREFIRTAFDLDPVPRGLAIPPQGPTRPAPGGGKNRGGGGGAEGGGGMGMAAGRHADNPATGA